MTDNTPEPDLKALDELFLLPAATVPARNSNSSSNSFPISGSTNRITACWSIFSALEPPLSARPSVGKTNMAARSSQGLLRFSSCNPEVR